jgi:NADH-quinone oxidoreductase subunit N
MQFSLSQNDWLSILPALILCGWGMVLLLADLVAPKERVAWIGWLSMVGLAGALVAEAMLWGSSWVGFGGMVVLDGASAFIGSVGLLAALLTVWASLNYIRDRGIERGEYYALLLFSTGGILLMAQAANLIVVFLGLELLSIPLYILAGFARPRQDSEEAALKYFMLGAFATGFLVYGIALVYGATRTTDLARLAQAAGTGHNRTLLLVGAGLLLVGLGFKVAAVPFHMWTPDVYEGAPTPVAGFMSVGAKAAGFAALLRVFLLALSAVRLDWMPALAILSALTMIVGNLVALAQTNLKRMLAYSSVAHAGYMLMGVAAGNQAGFSAVLFYLLVYAFTNIGAFAVLAAMASREGEDQTLAQYAGLGRKHPWLAVAMALFMLSLTGLPPTGGFFGKYYLFLAAVTGNLGWLALVGVVTSVISAFFYLRVIVEMTMREPKRASPDHVYPALVTTLAVTALGALMLGVWPGPWLQLAQAGLKLFGG